MTGAWKRRRPLLIPRPFSLATTITPEGCEKLLAGERVAGIRVKLAVAEGDGYNQTKIDKSTSNLKDLGFFKSQNITNSPGTTP